MNTLLTLKRILTATLCTFVLCAVPSQATPTNQTFAENINLINERLTNLLVHIEDLREQGQPESQIINNISTVCTELQKELDLPNRTYAVLLTEHIASLINLSSIHPSTRTLAQNLNDADRATLVLIAQINAQIAITAHYAKTIVTEEYSTATFVGMLPMILAVYPAYYIGINYDSFLAGSGSWLVSTVGFNILSLLKSNRYRKLADQQTNRDLNTLMRILRDSIPCEQTLLPVRKQLQTP